MCPIQPHPSTTATHCFHCGLDASGIKLPPLDVLGEARHFCCQGCRAVCAAIVDSGNSEFYRVRDSDNATQDTSAWQQYIEQTKLYDRAEIQAGFVRQQGALNEAFLLLDDVRCSACIWLNERHLRALPGVAEVDADYTAQRMRVRWDAGQIRLSQILKAVAAIGYRARPYDAQQSRALAKAQRRRGLERVIAAGVLGMMVMHFSLASYLLGGPDASGELPLWQTIGRWTGLLVATAILAWPGQEFFLSAWRDLRNRRLGMDVPVVIGLSLAWVGSLNGAWTQSGEVYLDSIAMFVLLLLLSRHIELKARLRAAANLDRLSCLAPDMANKISADNSLLAVPVSELEPGDRVLLRPGERVPADAMLVEQAGLFDEALLTGEAEALTRNPGDPVPGGSINAGQALVLEITAPASESSLNRVAKLARESALHKPPVARLSDQAARYFVGLVLVLATLTAVYHTLYTPASALENVIAVLIVTCPCALALATPIATSLSAGKLVDLGMLPLRMQTLEALARIDTVVLDKTGTLTLGEPQLVGIQILDKQYTEQQLASIAAALEQRSEHPLAHAFRNLHILPEHKQIEGFAYDPGVGLRGRIGNTDWQLGAPARLLAQMPDATDKQPLNNRLRAADLNGQSLVLLLADQTPVAWFVLEDPLRDGLARALNKLRRRGLRLHILSGDRQAALDALASKLDARLDAVLGEQSAAQKLAYLKQLRQQGRKVLMLGDGINDAPVLAAADVSISFQDASMLAQVHSDYLVSGKSFSPVYAAIKLARRTRSIIRQNLLWAAAYNLLALPAAMLGWVPAWGAAIGMSLSSLIVVVNSNRL